MPLLSEDSVFLEEASPEALSTLEALDDIADTVESIVFSLAGAEERDAYLALADEYDFSPIHWRTRPENPRANRPAF